MQNVPKIVRQRLQAATPAVNHPDADLLTAFAERSLPEAERAVVLEHLARCGDCRDIVALALPAMEPVETATSPSASRWLTWPALRWGFVAAGVVAIASIGILQYQRRTQPTTVALKQSAHVEVAANEPKKESLHQFVAAAPAEKREKLQSPSTPAFADSVQVANGALDAKKSMARADAPPAPVLPPQAGGGMSSGRSAGAAIGGPLTHGPRVATNQWQQQNTVQNQAPMPVPPSAYSKQQVRGDLSANTAGAAPTQKVELSSAAPAIASADADLYGRQGQSQPTAQPPSGGNSAYAVGKAKPPMPSASRADVASSNQTSQDQALRRLKAQPAPGQIGGYVVDPTGAAVSNARITITPSKTAPAATAVTNSQGAWLIAGLPTGNYKAQAEAPGFKTSVLDLNYDANQPSLYRFTLSLGSAAETVEVSAENAQVQTEGTVVGGLIADRQLSEIPTNGRNFTEISTLSPGLLPRWTITSTGGLQRSFDQGKTWQTVDVNANPASFDSTASLEVTVKASRAKVKDKEVDKARKRDAATLTFRAVAATGLDVWAGGSAGALYHSIDAGNNWSRVAAVSSGAILTGDIISLEFPDPQHGRLSTSTSEVWTTSDGGQTWQKQ